MLAFLSELGIEGATVLEIGGGVGEIQLELLKRGAAHATNLELSPAYEEEANRLLRELALEDRAERRLHDIAVEPDGVEAADIVVLHRVVCCYPDYERLLGAAEIRTRRLLVFSYPPRNALSRLFVATENLVFKLLRKEYRSFVHPPAAMLGLLDERVVRSLDDQHGNLDVLHRVDGRLLLQPCQPLRRSRVADALEKHPARRAGELGKRFQHGD